MVGLGAFAVYMTEISSPHVRGALNSTSPMAASFGILISYVLGLYTTWRTTAWIAAVAPLLSVVLLYLVGYESPIWLVSKGRHEDALTSLRAFSRYNTTDDDKELLPRRQLDWLLQRHSMMTAESDSSSSSSWYGRYMDVFRMSGGYKPFLVLTGVFATQSFSGVYITLFYAADFFQEMGFAVDELQAAVYVGLTRFLLGILAIVAIRHVGLRVLMIISSAGMTLCMALSGYYTLYRDNVLGSWLPVGLILLYVAFSCCGMLPIPWTMTAEVYPDRIREAGQGMTLCVANVLMFASLQSYPMLRQLLQDVLRVPGSVGIQWFFAAVAAANVLYVVLFLPETRGKTLDTIEDHYRHNIMWLGRRRKH